VVYAAIARAAKETGVPLSLALAIAQHESGFNPSAPGDRGYFNADGTFTPDPNGPPTSFGLYQLHQHGMLGNLTPDQASDPYTNAKVALKSLAETIKAHPGADLGTIAALSQRPADMTGYANTINSIIHSGSFTASDPTGSAGSTGLAPTGPPAQTMTGVFQANPTLSINQYGAIAALAHTNPEIAKLMAKYANEDLSNSAVQLRLEGELKNTKWYKTTTDAQRAAQTLQASNPTEYHRQFANALLSATNLANQLGVHLPGLGLHDFAANTLNNGWTAEEQRQYLLAEGQKANNYATTPATAASGTQPGQAAQQPTGDIGSTMTKLQSDARDYLVPISDVTQQQWAQKIMTGQVNENDYLNYLKTMAKSLHPEAAQAIDSGVTPQTYYDPYKQVASQVLQVPPDSVNFDDPKWQKALFQVDPKTGARTSMSLADWGKTLRSDPTYGYSKTPQAQATAADFAENILNTFGAVGNYGGNG
jgi:hypothetical protein